MRVSINVRLTSLKRTSYLMPGLSVLAILFAVGFITQPSATQNGAKSLVPQSQQAIAQPAQPAAVPKLPVVQVTGVLTSSQTWVAGKVYVANSVVVPSGKTLTLQPGTVVKVPGDNTGIRVSPGGKLNVTGSSTSPVIFTSYRDDTAGGDTNADGDATTAGAGDYTTAIFADGGTTTVSHAAFWYTRSGALLDDGSSSLSGFDNPTGLPNTISISDSQFANNASGFALTHGGTLTLKRNSFATPDGRRYPFSATGYSDLSGIVLSGTDKNTFSGPAPQVGIFLSGDIPAGKTWTIDKSGGLTAVQLLNSNVLGTVNVSGGLVLVSMTTTVKGTLTLQPGTVVKVPGDNTGIRVSPGGKLNVTGSSTSPVIFTSYRDDTAGGDTNADGDATTAGAGDVRTFIRYDRTLLQSVPLLVYDNVSYAEFKYANSAISDSAYGALNVSHSQFVHNQAAIDSDTTSTNNPALGALSSVCLYPYENTIHISHTWFGTTGRPGSSMDLLDFIGLAIPDDQHALGAVYGASASEYSIPMYGGDNTLPWSLFTCGIPDTPIQILFPVTPVDALSLANMVKPW